MFSRSCQLNAVYLFFNIAVQLHFLQSISKDNQIDFFAAKKFLQKFIECKKKKSATYNKSTQQ